MPVPQPDVLKRGLVVRRVGRVDRGLGGKLALREPIEPERLPRHLDVVRDVWLFAHQLVRLDDEAARRTSRPVDQHVSDDRRQRRDNDPASTRESRTALTAAMQRAEDRARQPRTADRRCVMCASGVVDTVEERVMLQQQLEPLRHNTSRQARSRRKATVAESPRQGECARLQPARSQRPGAAGHDQEQDGHHAQAQRQREQPALDQPPGRQGEEEEVERPPEDRVGDDRGPSLAVRTRRGAASATRHAIAEARDQRDRRSRRPARSPAGQERPKADRRPADDDRMVAGQIRVMRAADQEESTVQDKEGDGRRDAKTEDSMYRSSRRPLHSPATRTREDPPTPKARSADRRR